MLACLWVLENRSQSCSTNSQRSCLGEERVVPPPQQLEEPGQPAVSCRTLYVTAWPVYTFLAPIVVIALHLLKEKAFSRQLVLAKWISTAPSGYWVALDKHGIPAEHVLKQNHLHYLPFGYKVIKHPIVLGVVEPDVLVFDAQQNQDSCSM